MYKSLKLVGCAAVLLAIALWPVRYPVLTLEENPDAAKVVMMSQSQPVTATITMPAGKSTGIVLWTNEQPPAAPDTRLELRLEELTKVDPPLVGSVKKFKDVFNISSRAVRFDTAARYYPEATPVRLVLTAPALDSKKAIPIRYQLHADGKVAYQLLSSKPLSMVVFSYIQKFNTEGEDIFYAYHEGQEILAGKNPYLCARNDKCLNHKNPTYFPLFYWLSAATQKAGLRDYADWIAFWKPVFLGFYGATAALIFVVLYRRGQTVLALFGTLFWLLNRWSLFVARVGHLDFMALFFLVASVILLPKRYWASLFFFSVSLAIKQVAIFLVPLYIVYAWRNQQSPARKRPRPFILSLLLIASVPLLSATPFIVDNASAVANAVLFSAVRGSEADFGAPPIGTILYLPGTSRIYVMLFLILLITIASWHKKLSLASSTLLIFTVFLAFNTVIFNQYFIWFIPFLSLVASEWPARSRLPGLLLAKLH